jgi:hypothetical protein
MTKMELRAQYLNELLAVALPVVGSMVEVGSGGGDSARIFLDSGKVTSLVCVDPWGDAKNYYDKIPVSSLAEAEKRFDTLVGHDERVTKMKLSSLEAARLFENNSVDFVYIDGNHSYAAVLEDITAWLHAVRNKRIGGHDFDKSEVREAVLKVFLESKIVCFGRKNAAGVNWLYIE